MKLTGADMAEMDAQIAQNEADIMTLYEQVGAVPGQRLTDIRKLKITSDADSIFLYHGTELLASISMPDVSSIIQCTGLTASADLSSLIVGGSTALIQTQRQPSDCNQSVRFLSSDTSVVTVNSLGEVTAVGSGIATITVACGSYSVILTAHASRRVSLTGNMHVISWISDNPFMSYAGIQYRNNGDNIYIGNIPYSFEKFRLRPGETCTLRRLDNHVNIINPSVIFKEADGKTLNLVDLLEDFEVYMVDGAAKVAENVRTDNTLLTYTNNTNENLYLAFAIKLDSGWKTESEVIADIDTYIELIIGAVTP